MANTSEGAALLVMDVQPSIVDRLEDGKEYLESVKKAVDTAHHRGIPVIFVVVGFRPGLPEISPHNRSFSQIKKAAQLNLTNPVPAIALEDSDVVVTKRRVSAFTGSDLEVILRAQGIHRLVLCGVATSGVVLSTVREAADMDYELTVLSDLCRDFDSEVHKVLMEKVFPRQATVVVFSDWE